MKPGGLCFPSDGSNMPSGDAVGAVPACRPPDSCNQFPKASTTSRESHACLTPDLYEHNHVIRPTNNHLNGLLSYAGLPNGVYGSQYTSNKGLSVPRHILSPPQSEDGEDEGPASCTTSHGAVTRDCSSALLCLHSSNTAVASASSHLASPTCSLPNVCGKGFEQLTVVTSSQEGKSGASTESMTSGDASCFPFVGSSVFSPKAAHSGFGSGTFSSSCEAFASPKSSKRPRGRKRKSLEEMVAKLHNRSEANWSGVNVLQNFSTQRTVNHRVIPEKSLDCLHKDFPCLSSENNSVVKSSYQSGQSLPNICDNNNTATIYDAHLSKDSSIKDINSKSDSGDICCGEGSSLGLPERTSESTVTNLLKEFDKSRTVLSENVPVILPNVNKLKKNITNSASNISESHITKCSNSEDVGADTISSLSGDLQKKHEETRLIDKDHDVVRTEGSVGSLVTSAGTSRDGQTENVLNQHNSQGQCISEDLQSKSDHLCDLDLQNVQYEVVSKLKQFKEMCMEIPVQTAAKVTSDDSVIDLTVEPENVRCNSVELLENASVESRDCESDIEVLFEKGVGSEKSSGPADREPRSSNSSDAVKEFVRPIESRSDDSGSDNLCSDSGTVTSSDSVQEICVSKEEDEAIVPASLVNTDCESVQYLEPISDDENSLLCAPSLSSGLSSVSGFQSNSDTPMFSDTPSDASRGTLMVRISDAVAAILSDVSDESLPSSPLASNSNSVDGFHSLLPKKKLSEKIDSICDKLQRECLKDSSLHPLELGNCSRLQSDVHSENYKEVFYSDIGKERTAFQLGISEKSEPSNHVSSDIVQPEVGCAYIQKQTDLGLNLPALSFSPQPVKDLSFESLLPAKSIYEFPSGVKPDESVSKTQGSENQSQVAHPSDPDQHIDKLAISDSHKEFSRPLSLVPGFCAVTTISQSSSNSALSPDTHVTFSSHTQVPIEDLGTVVCSSMLNTGNNLCQNHISGSQTISSQTQNCNTSQIESKENAAGLLLKIPSAITLDNPSRSEQSIERVTDDGPHRRNTSHLEIHTPDNSPVGGDDSLPQHTLNVSCMEPLSRNESNHLSLMPDMNSLKDICVPGSSNIVHVHEETLMKHCLKLNESVANFSDNLDTHLQTQSDEPHLTTETSDFTVVKDHILLGSVAERASYQSCEKMDAKEMVVSSELSLDRTSEDIHSEAKETGFVPAGFPEMSSLEHIQPSSGHTTVHSSVSMEYAVKDNISQDQAKNNPVLEASMQKKTSHSPEVDANLSFPQIGTKGLSTSEPPNKECSFAIGIADEHGQRGGSLVTFRDISNEFDDETHSMLMLDKVKTCSSDVLNDKNKSSEELDSSDESLLQVNITRDDGSLSDLTENSKSSGDSTDQSCSSTELNLKCGTSTSKTCATLPNYSTESVTDPVSSEVPIFDEKSSLPESSTTENSVVAAYPFPTVALLPKHDSIDQTSYQSSSEGEWSTSGPHPQIFTTSNSLAPYEESTSPDASASLEDASEFSRPKKTCSPLDGAASDSTHPSHNVNPLVSNVMIHDTLKDEKSYTVDEAELSHARVVKVAPKDIRPPLEAVEDNYQPAEVIQETSHQVSVVIAPENYALYTGTTNDMLLPIQDATEVSHQPSISTEVCHLTTTDTNLCHYPPEVSEINHQPSVSPEICHQTTTDNTEVIPQPFEVTEVSHQPDATTEVCHIMSSNAEVSHQPAVMTEGSHSTDSSAEVCHPTSVAITGKQSTVAFDTHIHTPVEVTEVVHPLTSADVINPMTYITEDSHIPAKVTEVSYSPTAVAVVSHPEITASEVSQLQAVATEVSYSPTTVAIVSHPQVTATEVSHLQAVAAEVSYSPTTVAVVSHPQVTAADISHLQAVTTEVSYSLVTAPVEVSYPPAEVFCISPPLANEVSHSLLTAAKVGYPPGEVFHINSPQADADEVNHSPATDTEVSDLPSYTPEVTCLQAVPNEESHPINPVENSHPPAATSEVSFPVAVCAEVSCSLAKVSEVKPSQSAITEVFHQRCSFEGSSDQTAETKLSSPHTAAVSEVGQPPAEVAEVSQADAAAAEIRCESAGTLEISYRTDAAAETNHQSVAVPEFGHLRGTAEVSSQQIEFSTQLSVNHVPEVTDVTHSPVDITEVAQPPTVSAEVSCLPSTQVNFSPAEATEVCHLPAVTTEVSYLPSTTSDVALLPAAALEGSQMLGVTTEIWHLPAPAAIVSHPSAKANEISHMTSAPAEVSHPSAKATEVSHLLPITEVSHQPTTAAEVSQLSADTTEVSHPPTIAAEVSQGQTPITEVINPLANITCEVGHLPGVIPESSFPLTNRAHELLHSPPDVVPEGSHPHFHVTAGTSMQTGYTVPDVRPEIRHLVDDISGKVSYPQFQVTSNDWETPIQSTKDTEALLWITGKALQPHEISQDSYVTVEGANEISHPPNQSAPTVNAVNVQVESAKSNHMQVESTLEVSHSVAECTRDVSNSLDECAVEVNFSTLEATNEVQHPVFEATTEISHPSAEYSTDVNHLLPGYTPEISNPLADSSTGTIHPPTEVTSEINHSSLEDATDDHPLVEPTSEVSHSPVETHTEVTHSPVETTVESSHPSTEPNAEFSHQLAHDGPEVVNFPVESTNKTSHPPEVKNEVSYMLTKANINVIHNSIETTSETSYPPVQAHTEGIHLTYDGNTKVSHPSGPITKDGYPPVTEDSHLSAKVTNKVSSTLLPVVSEGSQLPVPKVSHSSDIAAIAGSHLPVEATEGSSHYAAESTPEMSYPPVEESPEFTHLLDETTTKVKPPSNEGTHEVSYQSIEPTLEVNHPPVEATTEIIHQVIEARSEATARFTQPYTEATTVVSHPPSNFTIDCKLTAGNVTSSVVSHDCGVKGNTGTATCFEHDKGQFAVSKKQTVTVTFGEETQKLVHPLCMQGYDLNQKAVQNEHDCCSAIEITGNPVCLTENNIRDLSVMKDGITKCSDTDNKKVPEKLQVSESHANDNTDQDATSLNETFDVSDDDENSMLELALVKEEVHQTLEDSLSNMEVDDTTTEIMATMAGASPIITDSSAGVQAGAVNHVLSTSNVDGQAKEIETKILDNKNIEGEDENVELEILGAPCPICFEQLNVPLQNHLIERHICNTFVPAKTSEEYQYHMLRRVKDVVEIPEPVDPCFENNAYVCRSCSFASRDINAVRFHLNTHEDVYQVKMGDISCKCNKKEYSYPFHKWKTLIHNSSFHCYKCNFYFACEKGFYYHLQAMHYVQNFCKICKAEVPQDSLISHTNFHKDEEEASLMREDCTSQNTCIVTRSSGGNFGLSWNIYDNCLNFLDGKDFRLSTCSKVFDTNLDRSYLKLPLKNVMEEALVPDEAKIDPGKDITKYMKGKKTIKLSLGDDNDEVLKNLSLSIQIELQKKVSRKGRRGHGSNPRAKREGDLFDVLGISSSRSRGAPKKEAQDSPGKQTQLKMVKGKSDEETKGETEHLELPHLTRTRSGMQPGKSSQEKNEKAEQLGTTVVIEGEWSKEHTYICCSCGAGYLNLADIMDHKWEMHPSVWCAHTMIQGQGVIPHSFCRQYQPPTSQPHRSLLPNTPTPEMQTGPSRGTDADDSELERKDQKICTSCSAQFEDVNLFHAHLVECGGLSLFSSMKKKNKKGYRFKRRKGQGVPNNRYGNSSQPSTPLKVKTGDRSSGLNTPQNDRLTTSAVHSSGVKRRLELAVGSIDNLELKNRLKAIITGSKSKGSGAFGLPGQMHRMKLRKKALETKRLRKTRCSDRVKENVKKDQEKKEDKKTVSKSEKEDKSEVQETKKSEAQITKKSGIKKGSLDIVKEFKLSKSSVTKPEDSKSKEKSKKKVTKVSAVHVEGNVMVNEVSKPFTVPTSEVLDNWDDSKNIKDKSKQEEVYQESSQVEKKLEMEKRMNGVIDKVKKTKKKNDIADDDTKSFDKSGGLKVKQPSDKKASSKSVKNTLVTKLTETTFKHDGMKKVAGPIERKENVIKKDTVVPSKQNIGKKIVGAKLKQVLSKSIGLLDKSRNNKDKKPLKNENNKQNFIESEPRHDLPLPAVPPKMLGGENKIKSKKTKEFDNVGVDTKVDELEKKESDLKKSSSFDQCSTTEVDSSELQMASFVKGAKTKIQEVSEGKENEIKETVVSRLPKVRRRMYYSSSSEDSEDSDSEPEVIRNFRRGSRCGGRMGLRNRRKPLNTRYSFRTCFTSAKKDDETDVEDDEKHKKVDYQEKEEEEFSEELPLTSKRKRKVANYENQDDYTYVPYESSSDPEDDMSGKEMDIIERIPWSSRKKRKILTRSKKNDTSKPLNDTPLHEENWSEELQMVEIPVTDDKKEESPFEDIPGSTSLDKIENEVQLTKRKKNINLVNTYSDNPEIKHDEKGVNELKIPKAKKKTKVMNNSSVKPELKEDKMEIEVKLPKKKNTKLLNTFSDTIDVKDDEISTKVPKKKKNVILLERLSSDNTSQEGVKDVGKLQKTKNVKEIPPQMVIASIQEASEGNVGKPQKKNVKFQNTVTEKLENETEETFDKVLMKNKCVRLQSNSCDDFQSNEVHPIVRKMQKKKNVKLQKDFNDIPQKSAQEMTVMVTKKKNVRVMNSVSSSGDCAQHETKEIVRKVEKEKKLMKSKTKSNNVFHHAQGEHFGSLSEYSLIGLPSTAKRKKKVLKKNKSLEQDMSHTDILSSHNLAEEDEDNLPLSTLAYLNIRMKKEKLIFNMLKSNKSAVKECEPPKQRKVNEKLKKTIPVKNRDLFIKDNVAFDSESSSFEGFAPVPFKKSDRRKTAFKKTKKRLDQVKSLIDVNASSTASESESSDVPKPLQKPKELSVFSCDRMGTEDISMPNLSKFSKIKRDQENYPFHHQPSVKIQVPQERVRAKPKLKPALQENLDSAGGKMKVLKSSKKRNNSFIPHTMPVLEPMNTFEPDMERTSYHPESDSNGEGVPSLTQTLPAKAKRRRSSIEKIKDIPTRASMQQIIESQSPPELKAVIDESGRENTDISPLIPEHQMPLLKTRSTKPPQQRKRRTKSSQELLLKSKPEIAVDLQSETNVVSEVKNLIKVPGASTSQKRPAKRKRAASTSGVPSKDVQELVSSLKEVDQPHAHLSFTSKKNPDNMKRKKTGNSTKQDVNELKCIDCGLKFGSVASLEDHQQDCVTIAFEMSLMEAEDHLFECPHCHLTFALKGTQRKHTASCRMVKYKRTTNRQENKTLKKASKSVASQDTQLSEVVASSDLTAIAGPPCRALVKDRRHSKENVANDDHMACASPLRDASVPSFTNHSSKVDGNDGKLQENTNKVDHMQRVVVPLAAIGSPKTKKASQVNGKLVNGDILDLFCPVNVDDNQKCSVCGVEVTDKDLSHKHQLLKQFTLYCQQQAVLEVCALVTYYNLGIDAVRSLISSAIVYQGSTILSLDAKQQMSYSASFVSANGSCSSATKLQEILASPHCAWVSSILETIAKHHQTAETVSISGTRQEALKAVSALEEILKEMSEVDSAIRKNLMLKSMRETFEAGTLN